MKAFLMGICAMVVIAVAAYLVMEGVDLSAQETNSSTTVRQ